MSFVKRRIRRFILIIVNAFFSGTHFWFVKKVLLSLCNINMGENTKIVGPINVSNCSNIVFGNNTWIGENFTVYGDGDVYVGNNCDLGPGVVILTGSHEIGEKERRAGKGKTLSVSISDGCWIGAKAVLLGGVKVSNSSIIGACSFVNKNVKENVVVGGNPAKILREL